MQGDKFKLLDEKQAAEILNIAPQTLALWRMDGRYGLRYVKVGRAVRYRLTDLLEWIDTRTVGAGRETQPA